jgi:hypothetical protein
MAAMAIPPAIVRVIGTIDTLINKIAQAKALLGTLADSEATPKVGLTLKDLPAQVAAAREEIQAALRPITEPIRLEDPAALGAEVLASAEAAQAVADAASIEVPVRVSGLGGAAGEAALSAGLWAALGLGSTAGGHILGTGITIPWAASMGSLGQLLGGGIEHYLLSSVGIIGSMIGGLLGGALLGGGALSTFAVGAGTDLAGIGQALGDITNVYEAQTKLNSAIAFYNTAVRLYGAGSTEAHYALERLQTAQINLNQALSSFNPIARQAVENDAAMLTSLHTLFDQATGMAENYGAQIIGKFLGVVPSFFNIIGGFATTNMKIIMQDIQPLLNWLSTDSRWGGLGVFTNLEKIFQSHLPTGIKALTTGFELFAKVMTLAAQQTGPFIRDLAELFTHLNHADFGHVAEIVTHLITLFRVWLGFWMSLGGDIVTIFEEAVGLGERIALDFTAIFKVIGSWLHGEGGDLLHQLFTAHLQEFQALINVLQALGPLFASFFDSMFQVLTAGALLVSVVLRPIADVIGYIMHFGFAADLLGWAAAALIVGNAFSNFYGWLARGIDSLVTWILGLGASTLATEREDLAMLAFTGDTEEAGAALLAMREELGLTAVEMLDFMEDTVAASEAIASMAAETGIAGEEMAESGVEMDTAFGPAGWIAAGIAMVGLLAVNIFHLGRSAVTIRAVTQAVTNFKTTISQMPTTSVLHMKNDIYNLTQTIAKMSKQLSTLHATTTAFTTLIGKISAARQGIVTFDNEIADLTTNTSQLTAEWHITSTQLVAGAQAAGVALTQHLSPTQINEIKTGLKNLGIQFTTTGAHATTMAHAAAAAEATMRDHMSGVVATYKVKLQAMVAMSSKTPTLAMTDWASSIAGGLPMLEKELTAAGITIPKTVMMKLKVIFATGAKTAITVFYREFATTGRAKAEGATTIMMNAVITAMKAHQGTTSAAAKAIIKILVGTLEAGIITAHTAGEMLGRGIFNGLLTSAAQLAASTVTQVLEQHIVPAFQRGMEGHSPSRLTATVVGIPLGQGIGTGLIQSMATVAKDINTFIVRFKTAFDVLPKWGATLGHSFDVQLAQAIIRTESLVTSAAAQLGAKAAAAFNSAFTSGATSSSVAYSIARKNNPPIHP